MPPPVPTTTRRVAPPLEHRILMTATLCLLAFGAVMVYSASSPLGRRQRQWLRHQRVLHVPAGGGRRTDRHARVRAPWTQAAEPRARHPDAVRIVRPALAVLVPRIGVDVDGARRWFAAGPIQFQPSELMKLSLVLYVARYLADNPRRLQRGFKPAHRADRGRRRPGVRTDLARARPRDDARRAS